MFGYHLAPEINHQFEVGSYRLDNDLMHQQFALVYVLPTRMEKRIQDEIQELNPLIANSGGVGAQSFVSSFFWLLCNEELVFEPPCTLRMSELPFVLLQFLQATT
ncbi:hypothetical protein C5167_007889 [Papaver somniferum]|nr:hypothetical protein C5167_007889 [Papaver somniferum]